MLDDEPPHRPLRELPRLVLRGVAIVWRAARLELVGQVALQAIGAASAAVSVLLGARLLRHLGPLDAGREDVGDLVGTLVALAATIVAGALAASLADDRVGAMRRLVLRQHALSIGATLVGAAAVVGALVALLALVHAGRLDGADATAAGGALVLLGRGLLAAAQEAGRLYESLLYVHDVDALDAFAAAPPTATAAAPAHPVPLTARGLRFTYPSATRPALEAVDVDVGPGEVIALVGENGSGKTTLAKLLAGLYRPDAGALTWDGVDCRELDPSAMRPHVAMVMQDHMQWLLSAYENVALGRHERYDDADGVHAAARDAGIDGAIAALPAGMATTLGPEFAGGSELSGGQWQRIALARALFRDAPFVVLDEPSAALDPRAEHDLFSRLRALLDGRAALIVSHRFSTVRDADRIYVLDAGRVLECGDHATLMAAGGRYAELFGLQARAYADRPTESPVRPAAMDREPTE